MPHADLASTKAANRRQTPNSLAATYPSSAFAVTQILHHCSRVVWAVRPRPCKPCGVISVSCREHNATEHLSHRLVDSCCAAASGLRNTKTAGTSGKYSPGPVAVCRRWCDHPCRAVRGCFNMLYVGPSCAQRFGCRSDLHAIRRTPAIETFLLAPSMRHVRARMSAFFLCD